MRLALVAALALSLAAAPARAEPPRAEPQVIRVGLLAFGSVQWEIETIRAEGLDAANGIEVRSVETAGKDSTTIALQGGTVDAIGNDWLWVARQRAMGQDYTFIPWSTMTGAVLVPANSPIKALKDLAGKRIGVAGGPLDKSWLLLRALAAKQENLDLAHKSEAVFGAPPLLAEQFQAGRLDALLTFWQSAAQLEAGGAHRLIEVAAIPGQLGITSNPPLVGWVFHGAWANAHADAVRAFIKAEASARQMLCSDPGKWKRLDPLTHATDEATRATLRAGFCAGAPKAWGDTERADAARLFKVLAETGGPDLVGPATTLPDGTFWPGVRY